MKDITNSELLMLSYHFPPMGTIGTLRNYNFADQASRYFKKVHVITVDKPGIPLKEDFPEIKIQTHPVHNFDYRNFARLFESDESPFKDRLNASRFTGLVNIVRKVLNSYPTNLWFGEGAPTYLRSAYKKACKLISEGQIKFIYTSFRPYTDHYIAYKLKKKFPELFWIADFRDLHVNEFRDNIFLKGTQEKFNHRILKHADLLTTVSHGLAQHFHQYPPPVYVMRSGISELLNQKNSIETFDQFTISYSGSLHPHFQDAGILLRALRELIDEGKMDAEKVRFVHAGKDSMIWERWVHAHKLLNIFKDYGLVSFQKAGRIQKSAHINLLLSWSQKNQEGILTGKLYDYLGAKKPILLLIKGEYDKEFEDLFKDLNAGMISYHGEEYLQPVKDFLLNYYQQWLQNSRLDFQANESNLKEYTWQANFARFIARLEQDQKVQSSSNSPRV